MKIENRNLFPVLALTLLIGGCATAEGLWILTLSPRPTPGWATECDHNFTGADCAANQGDTGWGGTYSGGVNEWERDTEYGAADIVVVAEMVDLGHGETSMMIGGRVLQGERVDGSLVLTHAAEDSYDFREAHPSGFAFSEERLSGELQRIGLVQVRPGEMEGKLTSTLSSSSTWTETDQWDAGAVGRGWSSIPTWSYLQTSGSYTYYNYYGLGNSDRQVDCSGKECRLSVSSTLDLEWDVHARKLRTDDPSDLVVAAGEGFYLPGL